MLLKKKDTIKSNMFFGLEDMLNQKHPRYVLANQEDSQLFGDAFSPLYCLDNGPPAKPIRLMIGLLIIKHLRNISDKSVVEQWSENNYYQYFCGEHVFQPGKPYETSELVHFRNRIGESGMELILKESIYMTVQQLKFQNLSTSEKQLKYHQNKLKKQFRKRAAIEP